MADIPLDKLNEILDKLSGLRIKEAVSLRKRLQKEKQRLASRNVPIKIIDTEAINKKRSSKLHRYWRYVKLIHDNYPNLKTNQIRTQLKIRKQGQQTDIPDAVWQNPST